MLKTDLERCADLTSTKFQVQPDPHPVPGVLRESQQREDRHQQSQVRASDPRERLV